MTLTSFILACMLLLTPHKQQHDELAKGIADAIETKGCLYTGKDCQHRSASVMAVWAWYESHFILDAKGKQNDCGPFQHVTRDSDECQLLRTSAAHASAVAWEDMHASLKACGDLSAYARGNCSAGRGFVKRRMPLAAWLLLKVNQ
jgi:hypothetical protein